jgi:hypothetical protein
MVVTLINQLEEALQQIKLLQAEVQRLLSEPKILELLTTFGMHLSSGELSSWLTEEHQALFEAEKLEIVRAGLESTSYQHFDHTGTRGIRRKPGGEYLQLDDQIVKVKANKAQLLLVLSEPSKWIVSPRQSF